MFSSLRKAVKARLDSNSATENQGLRLSSEELPERYTLIQLYGEIATDNESSNDDVNQDDAQKLLLLDSCLSDSPRLKRYDGDDEYISKLLLWVSKAILPSKLKPGGDEVSHENARQKALTLNYQKAVLGLHSIQVLITQISSPQPLTLDLHVIIALITYSSSQDLWATPHTVSSSNFVLALYATQTHSSGFVLNVLNTFIRPLFSQSKPTTVTSTGRRAMPSSAPAPRFDVEAERNSKPWKYETIYAVRVLSWIVKNSPADIINQNWHLFTPPLLTLLDEGSTPFRVQGARLLSIFLQSMSAKVLQQSGIGEVFGDALMPTLLFLPNLTPVEESLQLLGAAYEALFVLCDVLYPINDDGKESDKGRFVMLDKIMREGVFTAYHHASEHPEIVSLLMQQTKLLIHKMSIHAVKHLRALIPILTTILGNPFAPSSPILLLSTISCLRTLLQNAWPRISQSQYRLELIKALCICWKDVREAEHENEQDLGEVREALKVTGRSLVTAVETDPEIDIKAELKVLVGVEKSLGDLFGIEE